MLAEVTARIDGVRSRQRELRAELADLHAGGSGLHRDAETVGRELAVAQERLRQLYARQEDARRELAPLHSQHETLGGRVAELQAAVAETQVLQAERQRAADTLQAEVGQRQEARQALIKNLDAARGLLRRQQDQQTDASSRLTQLGERRVALQAELAQHTAALEKTQQEVAVAEEVLAAAETQAGQADERVGDLQAEIRVHEQQIETLRGELRQAEETRRAADRALDRLHTRQDLLSRLREEGAGYGSGVRNVLSAAQSSKAGGRNGGQLRGILGTVANLLRVPSNLEKAVETALGGALQNVITESWNDASAAIEYLKQQRGGRATFLPLDRLSVLPPIAAPRARGILGNAVDLVDFDAVVAPAMQQLLNRVWVAENLAAARSALDNFSGGARPTVVTLEGEIVRPGGAVTGGSDNTRGDDSLLSRERGCATCRHRSSAAARKRAAQPLPAATTTSASRPRASNSKNASAASPSWRVRSGYSASRSRSCGGVRIAQPRPAAGRKNAAPRPKPSWRAWRSVPNPCKPALGASSRPQHRRRLA